MSGWGDIGQQTEIVEKPKIIEPKKINMQRGLKIGIYGDFSTGKTHFSMTAPSPIYFIDTEYAAMILINKFNGKQIEVFDVVEDDPEAFELDEVKSYENILKIINKIVREDKGTVVIDSITDFWDYCQTYAKVKFLKIKPEDRLKAQWDWRYINNVYNNGIIKLRKSNLNVILTARVKENYTGPQALGTFGPAWQKRTGFWLDTILYNTKKTTPKGLMFESEIVKCRTNEKVIGKKYENLDFEKLTNIIKI